MEIVKSTGEREPFSKEKFCTSIEKAGAPRDLAQTICQNIQEKVAPGASTSKIYRQALRYLVREDLDIAARYSLHRGIAALGPAGFLFEQYVEAVLQAYGYTTKRDTIMQGACVQHEIDLTATKENTHYLLELKYHNEQGLKTHVNVVMYADARLMDISKIENKKEKGNFRHKMWLITNTKFTDTSIQYAHCKGIKLTGWNYPHGDTLEDMIARKHLYPVTVLPSVSGALLAEFARERIILAQDLLPYTVQDLIRFNLSIPQAQKLFDEVRGIIKNEK